MFKHYGVSVVTNIRQMTYVQRLDDVGGSALEAAPTTKLKNLVG